ncbi:MAG TPA: BT_3928 family protein [Ferruginibacter sp.]|nr:BT_3928 family protein [Ferruginibacter sp.]
MENKIMKLVVNIARVIVGVLFIFSGLIKAVDPLGLAYKTQEFFEAWGDGGGWMQAVMNSLHDFALGFSIIMIALEVLAGVALLIGWRKNIAVWVIFYMTLFYTFLTAYSLFTGKIRECGCFGNCFPITDLQTFIKNLVLLALIIIIIVGIKYINPLFQAMSNFGIVALTIVVVVFLQSYVLEHLPLIDCLPYKVGNNILELRKMPADATFDTFAYSFVYKKGSETKEFTTAALPDSTWQFVEQKKVLVEKGNGKLPAINDFSLTDRDGNDSTEAILSQNGKYYLFFINTFDKRSIYYWLNGFVNLRKKAKADGENLYVVTSDNEKVDSFLNVKKKYNVPVYTCDMTAIKTAARTRPTLFLMNGPVVEKKWGSADIESAVK